MIALFFILILIACIILAFFVLIQNPEGGGLSGSIGGFGNQVMGVKKTNNVLEKGTWLFVTVVGLLCLISVAILGGKSSSGNDSLQQLNNNAPAQQQPAPAPSK